MRVLVVHSRYRSTAPSGENAVVDQERAALIGAGHEVERFERSSDDIAGWSLHEKAALPARAVWNRPVRHDLAHRLRRSRPDVVHVHNTFPLMSASVLTACRDADVPVVVTFHNYKLLCASGEFFRSGRPCHDCGNGSGLSGLLHGCYRDSRLATAPVVLGNAVHRRAWRTIPSAYIFLSQSQRELMRALRLPDERVFISHNFVPEAAPDGGEREHAVVYLGRLDPAKGLPLLMSSWDELRRRAPESRLRLRIVGGGVLESEVRAWASRHDTVEMSGLLSRQEAGQVLGRAVAAVVPSAWEETFGLVAVEAMAAGVAPLAPARGSFPELVAHGHSGALYDPEDDLALADLLGQVDAAPERFLALGRRARDEHARRFGADRKIEDLLRAYEFAAANPAQQP
jgi:glycosyltransferase involved in cell wall biosynthesis